VARTFVTHDRWLRHQKHSMTLLVAAITAKVAAAIIEIAVVGELVDVLLLARRVTRVIVGDVLVSSVLIRIVVNNAMAAGLTTAAAATAAAAPDIVDA
jgi:hypothetical protein